MKKHLNVWKDITRKTHCSLRWSSVIWHIRLLSKVLDVIRHQKILINWLSTEFENEIFIRSHKNSNRKMFKHSCEYVPHSHYLQCAKLFCIYCFSLKPNTYSKFSASLISIEVLQLSYHQYFNIKYNGNIENVGDNLYLC